MIQGLVVYSNKPFFFSGRRAGIPDKRKPSTGPGLTHLAMAALREVKRRGFLQPGAIVGAKDELGNIAAQHSGLRRYSRTNDGNQGVCKLTIVRMLASWHPCPHQNQQVRQGMPNTLETLVKELVNSGDSKVPADVLPAPEAIELDSEEAWNDFQDSQIAYDKSFQDSRKGSL